MFTTHIIRGSIEVPRFTGTGQDLFKVDPASHFANAFMRRYAHKGVKDLMVFMGEKNAELHFTLVPYYPDKCAPTDPYWFHKVNLDTVVTNFHREFPHIDRLTDV